MDTEPNPTALKKQRATIKAACTRISNFVESVTSINPFIKAQLEERKNKLEHYWSEYDKVQTQLELLVEVEGNDRVAFEDSYYKLAARIRELFGFPVSSLREAAPSPSVSNASEPAAYVRLPKLSFPRFSGKYEE